MVFVGFMVQMHDPMLMCPVYASVTSMVRPSLLDYLRKKRLNSPYLKKSAPADMLQSFAAVAIIGHLQLERNVWVCVGWGAAEERWQGIFLMNRRISIVLHLLPTAGVSV